ncbi:MAG: hypothetical protein M1819_005542 [Sarea resinae]|nr:MAG: hypothetical protein M1819_005542 [Sarea resinae]
MPGAAHRTATPPIPMSYNVVVQREHDVDSVHSSTSSNRASPSAVPASTTTAASPFSLQPESAHMHGADARGDLSSLIRRTLTSASSNYDMVEDDDYEQEEPSQDAADADSLVERGRAIKVDADNAEESHPNTNTQPEPAPESERADSISSISTVHDQDESTMKSRQHSPEPLVRTYSSEGSIPLRHPTPDLQSLQGAYLGNVERLERSAETLSQGSDVEEELRKLKLEQKRSESRRSSILTTQIDEVASMPPVTRQFSSGSMAHSIVGVNTAARSGGYSPGGYITSPRGSIRSASSVHYSHRGRQTSNGSRLAQLPEPEQEGRPLDSVTTSSIPPISPPPEPTSAAADHAEENLHSAPHEYQEDLQREIAGWFEEGGRNEPADPPADVPERPSSGDTFQQAKDLFVDFDGVHIKDPRIPSGNWAERRVSRGRPQSSAEPLPGQNMVYYPAPVPVMLNLPQRLSNIPSATHRNRRRSHMLESMAAANRKSTTFLSDPVGEDGPDAVEGPERKARNTRHSIANMTDLPPQLRASAFFEHPSLQQDIEIKGGSAVATLESILEASASAPVSAFTDHPIVGHIGADVYSKSKPARRSTGDLLDDKEKRKSRGPRNVLRKRSSVALLEGHGKRSSSRLSLGTQLDHKSMNGEQALGDDEDDDAAGERTPFRRSRDLAHSMLDHNLEGESWEDVGLEGTPGEENLANGEESEYFGPPTTLLAELQLRKLQQKQRSRTAATAFPNGMRSTLLQLDTVAQVQQQSRQQKRITLAWEDPNMHTPGEGIDDDEDVPLGMLFPGRDGLVNQNGGDDDRPLGLMEMREIEDNEPLSKRRHRLRSGAPISRDRSPAKRDSMMTLDLPGLTQDEDSGGEQEPDKRLRAGDHKSRTLSADFASELMSQFGGEALKDDMKKTPEPPEGDEEETLGQRRKRLQAEREAREREMSHGASKPQLKNRHSMADILQVQQQRRSSTPLSRRGSQEMLARRPSQELLPTGLLYQNEQLQAQRNHQLREQNRLSSSVGINRPLVDVGSHQMQQQKQYPFGLLGTGAVGGGLHYAPNGGGLVMGAGTPYGGLNGMGTNLNPMGSSMNLANNQRASMNGFPPTMQTGMAGPRNNAPMFYSPSMMHASPGAGSTWTPNPAFSGAANLNYYAPPPNNPNYGYPYNNHQSMISPAALQAQMQMQQQMAVMQAGLVAGQQALDQRQREQRDSIDRWRMGVIH